MAISKPSLWKEKYWKPNSLLWVTTGAVPICAGGFMALEPVHRMTEWTEVIRTLSNNMDPSTLVYIGLAGLGLSGRSHSIQR